MSKPRYAIVRVDNRCPVEEEEDVYLIDRIKMFPCFNDKRLSCKNCRYGDTKEQLIKKVTQAIKRKLKGGLILRNIKINKIYNIQKIISAKAIAKEIVEFLGVEE